MGTFSVRYTQEEYAEKINNIYSGKFSVAGEYTGGKNCVLIRCNQCGAEFERYANNILHRHTLSCPVCDKSKGGKKGVVVGVNDMWTTNPDEARLLKNPDDGYRYTFQSKVRLAFICPNCGEEHFKPPRDMFGKNGNFRCNYCTDGFPYPEKFMNAVLKQCGAEYIYQYSSKNADWCKGYRYDFYIPEYNVLVETHGVQHYYEKHKFFMSFEEQQRIDNEKKLLAEEHGIKFISIDCCDSTVEYIKQHIINSELSNYIDLSSVDWEQCGLYASKSTLYAVCQDWDGQYKTVEDLVAKYHITDVTAVKYLKEGANLGLCDFDIEDYRSYRKRIHYTNVAKKRHKPIKCIETGKEYISYADIKREEGFYITKSFIGNPSKTSNGFHWVYIDKLSEIA